MHKSHLEQRERYIFLKRLNKRYLRDNTKLYRMVRLQRLQLKEAKANPSSHITLSTLAEQPSVSSLLKPPKALLTPLTRILQKRKAEPTGLKILF